MLTFRYLQSKGLLPGDFHARIQGITVRVRRTEEE
jgi:hypothetical protein